MPLRVTELRLPLDGDESTVVPRALRLAGVLAGEIESVELVRKSLEISPSSVATLLMVLPRCIPNY